MRIYYPQCILASQSEGDTVWLEGDAAHHLGTVLRARIGEKVTLFNGQGGETPGVIAQIEKKRIQITLSAFQAVSRESSTHVHLMQGLAKGEKMDWIIQKAVELGVFEITPIITQYTAVKNDAKRFDKKLEHWQKIAISACEQCGGNVIPQIHPIQIFQEVLSKIPEKTSAFILHLDENAQKLPQTMPEDMIIFIGPEGGFSDKEYQEAVKVGVQGITLGARILRTETAALATLAKIFL